VSHVTSWLSRGESDLPDALDWLHPRERGRAGRMRFRKRRNDYLLGRFTAKQAVTRALGRAATPGALAAIEVRNAPDGAPELYCDGHAAELAISMTDRADQAVCLLGPRTAALGCDLELVEPRSEGFLRDYLTDLERRQVEAAGPCGRDLAANLLWCAKESALKVLRTGLRRDTRSVEVRLGGGLAGAEAGGEGEAGWLPLEVATREGPVLPGWWRRFGPWILSVAADGPLAPPLPLEAAPGLARALPRHAWLEAPLAPALDPEPPGSGHRGPGGR